jgi:type III pantothenate kinase
MECQELKQTHYSKIIKIKAKKKQIGSDRIANAIGSYYTYKSDCIVLDFGTATTFDVINRDTYLGGIIAPGVNLSLSTLTKRAILIPPFTIKKINRVIGNNTLSALRSGFYWGYTGMIENILRLIKKETKKSYKIILTGGYSSLFKNSIKPKVFIDEDITMKGLIELLRVK